MGFHIISIGFIVSAGIACMIVSWIVKNVSWFHKIKRFQKPFRGMDIILILSEITVICIVFDVEHKGVPLGILSGIIAAIIFFIFDSTKTDTSEKK